MRLYRFFCIAILSLAAAGLITTVGSAASKRNSGAPPAPTSTGETKRAFVVGVRNYKDPNIQQLSLAGQDAEGIAANLRQIGFDEKNVKLLNNPAGKDAFQTEFNKFLDTVKEGDVVFFYFSGHGYGGRSLDGQPLNYLLFGDVKSPIEFARTKASDDERKSQARIAARAESRELIYDYETNEVPARGISEKEILNRLEQKKPHFAIVVLDACRTLLSGAAIGETKVTGTSMRKSDSIPQGFMLMYSASYGQEAIESLGGDDPARNSLFTRTFREFMLKPGLELSRLADRVRERVTQTASEFGHDQEPDYINNIREGDFLFVASIGAERFPLNDDPCEVAAVDMDEIRAHPSRERLERHLKRFQACSTTRDAELELNVLAHGATAKAIVVDPALARNMNSCDRLAASEEDSARPPDVPGVNFGKIDTEPAIAACDKAASDNPRVVRYLFNLARAYSRRAQLWPDKDMAKKKKLEADAYIRYEDARTKGYVAAFNDLALMYDKGEGIDKADPNQATKLFQLGAKQGHPLAMYNLALRYRNGRGGLARNSIQAHELFAKAAEAGNVDAMVEVGKDLWCGCGVAVDPLRAVEWEKRAASTGSIEAKRFLGLFYFYGRKGRGRANSVADDLFADRAQSLLWFAQAAEEGDSQSQRWLAMMFEDGSGLTTQQPQLAERYWRMAAYGGNIDAKVEFAQRILSSHILLRPENGPGEVVQLLQSAMELGSSQAALRLAKLYRTGEFGYQVRPEEAMKYAYRAIDLAQIQVAERAAVRGSQYDNPLDEVAAGILLAEMAANGEAVDQNGKPLLTQDERDRLELYYGRPDPETKKVKVRSLRVEMNCGYKYFWIWDWGRDESPTEIQFQYFESLTPRCLPTVEKTRDTLKGLWELVRKDRKYAFADIVAAQADTQAR